MKQKIKSHVLAVFMAMAFCPSASSFAWAEEALPASVQAMTHTPLAEVGGGTYRKLGFSVYHVTLWTPDGTWNITKPHLLQLHYMRGISKDTIIDTVIDDIRDQGIDETTLGRWHGMLDAVLPSVEDGDTITAVALPGKKSLLLYNGKKILTIDEKAFIDAFFNIWLGEQADESLREKLLGRAQ